MAFLAFADSQIVDELKTNFNADALEQVRLIKDKRTGAYISPFLGGLSDGFVAGQSRQFAFAQFAALRDARAFVEQYYPSIQLQGSYGAPQAGDENARVRVAYSREKEDRDRPGMGEGDWICEVVGSNSAAGNKTLTSYSVAWPITRGERFVLGVMPHA